MAADNALFLPNETLEQTLHQLSSLLHLFSHRNKNQHRRSIWWRQFSTFRSQLDSLCTDLKSLHEIPTTHLARTKKKSNDARIISTTEKRLEFWRDVMVGKWQFAFSQVVADGRFAVLGLVLLAVLSEVCRVVGVTAQLEELGQGELEKVLEEFGREQWGDGGAESRSLDSGREDRGEVVQRDAGGVSAAGVSVSEAIPSPGPAKKKSKDPVTRIKKERSTNPRTKKRKKGGDAIDDLFNF